MTKIALLSDLHIDGAASPESWDRARAAFRIAIEHDTNHVVVCGDLFDSTVAFHSDADRVRRFLKRIGLWKPERLSIVPGNHDVYAVGHHRSKAEQARAVLRDSQPRKREFQHWMRHLVPASTRLYSDCLFPYVKRIGDLDLIGADTVASTLVDSASGFWYQDDDQVLRAYFSDRRRRRILAMHNPPLSGPEAPLSDGVSLEELSGYKLSDWLEVILRARGFVDQDHERLLSFLRQVCPLAVLCGHVHEARYHDFRVGDTPILLEGRTGLDEDPMLSVVTVTRRGVRRKSISVA